MLVANEFQYRSSCARGDVREDPDAPNARDGVGEGQGRPSHCYGAGWRRVSLESREKEL